MAISGVVGAIYKASGTSAAFTAQAMTQEAGSGNKRYYITDRTKAYWDNTTAVTVEKSTDGTTWTIITTGFQIEHAGGYVDFETDQAAATFRVSGKNFTPVAIGGGFNWTLDIATDTLEVTTFLSAGWKEFLSAQRGFSGSFEKYWKDTETWIGEVGNTNMILVLYADVVGASKARYEGYATITANSVSTPADDLITESCDFAGAGQLYYREG